MEGFIFELFNENCSFWLILKINFGCLVSIQCLVPPVWGSKDVKEQRVCKKKYKLCCTDGFYKINFITF
jgi:hypothetical protein